MFNLTIVNHYFTLLKNFFVENEIPQENIYNMDEKSIQLGGGQKCDRTKYFYSPLQKACVCITDANLELVTVIECTCADGSSLKLGFVFSGTEFCPEWFKEPNIL